MADRATHRGDPTNPHKQTAQQVIGQINEESRRLFIDTFETVRTHFQDLFRKIFGGGKADVILEDETDVLESGIEIIARPPGKEPRSISLLSGGEKTLAAVRPEWRIPGTIFTSGIINKNNPLRYHRDAGNFPRLWSCMYAIAADCGGSV